MEAARAVFDAAAARGMPPMRVLDIGGGFTAGTASAFQDACDVINSALTRHFGDALPGLQMIGEPGRYFAETPFTLAARVFGKRTRGEVREYWIDDGLFGTLCCVHMVNYVPRPALVSGALPPTTTPAMTKAVRLRHTRRRCSVPRSTRSTWR